MVESSGGARRNMRLQVRFAWVSDSGECGVLAPAEKHVAPIETGSPEGQSLTFTGARAARSVGRQHRGSSEGPL